jgi:signal peptidase I
MYPALIPGDYILVNKWLMGARIFDIWEAVEDKDVKIHRLPGLRKVKRNDVLVFHYPYPHRNDSISMDMMLYYVKRCIALPGDTVEIRKGCYWINGTRKDRRWARMETEPSQEDSLQWNVALGWTVQQLGPLPVPARGQEVAMDTLTGKMYGRLIAWEQKKPLTLRGDSVFLGDSLIGNYRFQENYYFMAGDNLDNSKDSRYWGLVPEPYIVGVATRVWKSVSPQGGEVRWNRTMKKIE